MSDSSPGTPVETLGHDRIPQLRNMPVYADGREVGHVGDVYYDETSGLVECVGIADDALGLRRRWVPVRGALLRDDGLHLPYDRGRLEDAPGWDDEADLDDARYGELTHHFTRAEEELQVGKREVPAGTVRLRKWVETEPVAVDVELRHETVQVVREPLDRPAPGAELGEEVVEATVRAETPVVEKHVVAKERIALEKDVHEETRTVTDEVRRERVEVEGEEEIAPGEFRARPPG